MPTVITDKQRRLHLTTETLAVFAAAPFFIWLGARGRLTPTVRVALIFFGFATIVVDGYLLNQFRKTKEIGS